MISRLKAKIVWLIETILYGLLTTRIRRFFISFITETQKEKIRGFLKSGKKQTKIQKVGNAKYKLRNLGFTEEAIADLFHIYETEKDPAIKRLAVWEIALWYANQQTKADAKKCLHLLPKVLDGEKDSQHIRQAAILTAECMGLLEDEVGARNTITKVLKSDSHPDLMLAAANLEAVPETRINWINKAYRQLGIREVSIREDENKPLNKLYDRLEVVSDGTETDSSKAKVTVIIPSYHAEDVIATSLSSILNQDWGNLEVIVVDDASQDGTGAVVEGFAQKDSRVKFIQATKNRGAYTSRNLALKEATGDFVTINDADDWSHPEKIKKQVEHLLAHPSAIGNTSQQARATEDFQFYRRAKPGLYIFSNMSSFMFRRKAVMEKLGYWDSVRFAGDSEFIKRVKICFGEKSIVDLPTGPLSFQRQSGDSLTGNSAFGFPGFFMGARRNYFEAHTAYHQKATSFYYDFPMDKRPFPIPEPMRPIKRDTTKGKKHFDVIIVSDFRLDGGSTLSSLEEIKAQQKSGLKTGLIQCERFDYFPRKALNPRIREQLNQTDVEMIVYGEEVSCDLLLLRYPPAFQVKQRYVPQVEAKEIKVIVNQTPMSDYGVEGVNRYDIKTVAENVKHYFGRPATWHPIGPLVRNTLETEHKDDLASIKFSDDDWVNIIDINEWLKEDKHSKSTTANIRIGRHSRDHAMKWPGTKEDMMAIYPTEDPFQVHVLGGAESAKEVIGDIPANWTVYNFGELSSNKFLQTIDVYVYYTHPDWVESFGRVIIEAMASGVPVIIPYEYKPLFKEAAIYADIKEVQTTILTIMEDQDKYRRQTAIARKFVEDHFSYQAHDLRINAAPKGEEKQA